MKMTPKKGNSPMIRAAIPEQSMPKKMSMPDTCPIPMGSSIELLIEEGKMAET